MLFEDGSQPIGFSQNSGDSKIMSLAAYDAVNGKFVVGVTPERGYEIAKLTAKKFNQFKSYIQSGECTIEELAEMVMNRCGPYCKTKMLDVESDTLALWNEIQELGKTKEEPSAVPTGGDLLSAILSSFAKGGSQMKLIRLPVDFPTQIKQDPFAGAIELPKKDNSLAEVKPSKKPLYNANDEKWKKESSKAKSGRQAKQTKPVKKSSKKARERNNSGDKGKKNIE